MVQFKTVRRVITGGRFEPYVDEHGVEVVPGPPDRRDAVGEALSGVSDELARLPWDWPPRDGPLWVRGDGTLRVGPGAIIPACHWSPYVYADGTVDPSDLA